VDSLPPFFVAFAGEDVEDVLRAVAGIDDADMRDRAIECMYRDWKETATKEELSRNADRLVTIMTRCTDRGARALACELF
jgi:hypothetical protein